MPVFLPRESDSEKPGESANALHRRHCSEGKVWKPSESANPGKVAGN